MTRVVRSLNEEGTAVFRGWLLQPTTAAPLEILDDPRFSEAIAHDYRIDGGRRFDTTFELGRYLHDEVIGPAADRLEVRAQAGMWAWISLAMVHNLLGRSRKRKGLPLDPAHYIDAGARLGYRLICRTAWELVRLHGDSARVAISSRLSPWGRHRRADDLAPGNLHASKLLGSVESPLPVEGREYKAGIDDPENQGRSQKSQEQGWAGRAQASRHELPPVRADLLVREMPVDQLLEILPAEYGRWKQS